MYISKKVYFSECHYLKEKKYVNFNYYYPAIHWDGKSMGIGLRFYSWGEPQKTPRSQIFCCFS